MTSAVVPNESLRHIYTKKKEDEEEEEENNKNDRD